MFCLAVAGTLTAGPSGVLWENQSKGISSQGVTRGQHLALKDTGIQAAVGCSKGGSTVRGRAALEVAVVVVTRQLSSVDVSA